MDPYPGLPPSDKVMCYQTLSDKPIATYQYQKEQKKVYLVMPITKYF